MNNMLTFPYGVQDSDRLRGLSLAIHTLKQLTNNQYADIIDIASKYDHDETFIMSVIKFLKDIGWLSQDKNGKYIITEQGIKEISFLSDRK
jgi:predicted transcriptional regulator